MQEIYFTFTEDINIIPWITSKNLLSLPNKTKQNENRRRSKRSN